jgi:nuclear pore complex protein Nup155
LPTIAAKFALPSDNVNMSKIVGTNVGRIFLGGLDGSLNEVTYQAEEGWFTPKCRKLNYTASRIMQFFPSFLQRRANSQPIIDLVVDDSRNIMYSLHMDGSIQVVDLGVNGDAFRVVAHKTDIAGDTLRQFPGMFPDSSSAAQRDLNIVGIYPISSGESATVHLVAVTKTGVRLYFGTQSNVHYLSRHMEYDRNRRPESLILYHARFPPKTSGAAPVAVLSSPSRALALDSSATPEDVSSACFSSGVLLLADTRANSGEFLVAIGPDTSVIFRDPTGGTAPNNMAMPRKYEEFRENSFGLKLVDGKPSALAEIPLSKLAPKSLIFSANDPSLLRNELAIQIHLLPQREFLCLSASRLLVVQRSWPVDHLRQLLRTSGGNDTAALRDFRKAYGIEETCAMCLIIILNDGATDRQMLDLARGMFHHAGGAPRIEFNGSTSFTGNGSNTPSTPQLLLSPEDGTVTLSGCFEGISLYLTRLLRPIWHQPLFATGGSPFFNNSKMPREQLEQLQRQLLALKSFIEGLVLFANPQQQAGSNSVAGTPMRGRQASRQPQEWAHEKERQALQSVHALIGRCCELLSLLDLIAQCDSARVMNLVSTVNKLKVVQMRFGTSLTQNEEYLYTDLIDSVFRTVSSSDDSDKRERISDVLRNRCPSLFKEEDKIRMKAQECTQRAMLVADGDFAAQWSFLEDSLEHYVTIAAYLVERQLLADIVQLYLYFRFYRGAIELVLRCALASDVELEALKYYKAPEASSERGKALFEKRHAIYSYLKSFFDEMRRGVQPNPTFGTLLDTNGIPPRPGVTEDQLQTLFEDGVKFARDRDDELFHYWMYEYEYSLNATSQLVSMDTAFIEWWLKNRMQNKAVSLDLLCRYYQQQKRDSEAARCCLDLACLPDAELPSDVHISLQDRASKLSEAKLLATSSRTPALIREVSEHLELARIQQSILQAMEQQFAGTDDPNIRKAIVDLNSQLYNSTDLWRLFAARFGLREQALDILKASGSRQPEVAKRLWKSIFDDCSSHLTRAPFFTLSLTLPSSLFPDKLDGAGYNLDQLKAKVRELTFRYYPSVDAVFPLSLIVLDLELISIGHGAQSGNIDWVFQALVSDASNSSGVPIPELVTVYADLIERGGTFGVPPDAKIHLIRVLSHLLAHAIQRDQTGALPESQVKNLRTSRVRSTVARLLAELPKFGQEGSLLKEDFRRVDEWLIR